MGVGRVWPWGVEEFGHSQKEAFQRAITQVKVSRAAESKQVWLLLRQGAGQILLSVHGQRQIGSTTQSILWLRVFESKTCSIHALSGNKDLLRHVQNDCVRIDFCKHVHFQMGPRHASQSNEKKTNILKIYTKTYLNFFIKIL